MPRRTPDIGTCCAWYLVVVLIWQSGLKNLLQVHLMFCRRSENDRKSKIVFNIYMFILSCKLRIVRCAYHMTRYGCH